MLKCFIFYCVAPYL